MDKQWKTTKWDGKKDSNKEEERKCGKNGKEREMQKMLVFVKSKMHIHESFLVSQTAD